MLAVLGIFHASHSVVGIVKTNLYYITIVDLQVVTPSYFLWTECEIEYPRKGRVMSNVKKLVLEIFELMPETAGVTAMEYGLIAALVAVVIITGLSTIGSNLEATFVSIGSQI